MQHPNSIFNFRAYCAFALLACLLSIPAPSGGQMPAPSGGQMIYSITDRRDGQIYQVVKIGDTWWMAQNLNVGEMISPSVAQSNNSVPEKYCPNNSEEFCTIYGGLYQWDELMGHGNVEFYQGICPANWYVPTDEDWKDLEGFMGMSAAVTDNDGWRGTNEGGKLKSLDSYWVSPNKDATNEIGFSALPAGCVTNTGVYTAEGLVAYFYCADVDANLKPWFRMILNTEGGIARYSGDKAFANSARCVKFSSNICDRSIMTDTRDDQQYSIVLIGNHWWMAENLNIGTWIDLIGNQTDNSQIQKYCYNNLSSYCNTYGGLYQFNEMMNYNLDNPQGICPDGWHIPSDNDWKELEFAATMAEGDLDKTGWERGTNQGTFLKEGGGSGFEALLGGMINPQHSCSENGSTGYFWTANQWDTKYSWSRAFQSDLSTISRNNKSNQHDALSVRCVKDENEILTLSVIAPDIVCAGEEFTVKASVAGRTRAKSFLWTSEPPGFTSGDSIIHVTAETDVTYFVRVIDGYVYERDSVTIVVKPAPVIAIKGETSVCPSEELVCTYSVTENMNYSYQWFVDEELVNGTHTLDVLWGMESGSRSLAVEVTDENTACSSRNQITVEILQAPSKPSVILKGEHLLICPDSGLIYQWYKNDIAIPGANWQFYYARDNKPGTFVVETKMDNICGSISDPISLNLKSTGDIRGSEMQTVLIRPNPTGSNISLDMYSDFTGKVEMIISNSMGRIVKHYTLHKFNAVFNTQIDLRELESGHYFIMIEYGTDKEVHKLTIAK
ncbi:MAG: T9SS type A sorting domain-containing protein [Bacteroidales bacterium]|nr:T9SS type A sorting domain-containing protein [Bacteroidales bacterium]